MLIGVTVSLIVFSFAMFVFGFLCGHFCQKYQLCSYRRSHDQQPPKLASVLRGSEAGVDLNQQDTSELEMMDNMAYGPIKHGPAQ